MSHDAAIVLPAHGVSPVRVNARAALRTLALVALAVAGALAAAAHDGARPGADPRAAREIVALANLERAGAGQRALVPDIALTRAAEAYARELAAGDAFSHTGRDGSTLDTRAEASGYGGWAVLAENLSRSQGAPDAAAIVEAWMRSEGHRRNLLSPAVTEAGAACAVTHGRSWCVLELGARVR